MTLLRRMDSAAPWLPPVALMALIFFFSAQPNLNSGLGLIDEVGRKFVHASEYGLLCFLWFRALRAVHRAWLIAAAYAVTDEFHQRFVTGRHSTWVDVVIDSLGAAVVALLIVRRKAVA